MIYLLIPNPGIEIRLPQCTKNESWWSGLLIFGLIVWHLILKLLLPLCICVLYHGLVHKLTSHLKNGFANFLSFPCLQVIPEIIETCRAHDFTDVILVHEHRGVPDGLVISHLPFGPTAYFGLYNVVSSITNFFLFNWISYQWDWTLYLLII